ncbi:MAG: DUF4287 domain-containing protein [Ardenticatenaceae bacterium]|nr:DUF4287 domain-containing protein [Ardenticatenaceae bacterium]
MSVVDKALETQLQNIQTKTGKSLEELTRFVKQSGLTKHGQIRDMLKRELGLGHGDANTITHFALNADDASAAKAQDLSTDEVLDGIYVDKKAHLRPIHDKLMTAVNQLGEFEIAPKKTYVSLRRKKQFAMIGPATNSRVEVGLNIKDLAPDERLNEMGPGKMCNYIVKVVDPDEVDEQLIAWIEQAYHSAG